MDKMNKKALLERVIAHEQEGYAIESEMKLAGISHADLKAIRKAQAAADASAKTLFALLDEEIIETAEEVS